VNVDPPMLNGDTNFQKKVAEWRSFYIERYYENLIKPLIESVEQFIESYKRYREQEKILRPQPSSEKED
jgi:hypothetical protein